MAGTEPGVAIRPAGLSDVDTLVAMMRTFYEESGYPMDEGRARANFTELVGDAALGRILVAEGPRGPAAYLVLTFGYSMEFGGRDAFVDDLYVTPPFRGAGNGRALLAAALAECRRRGVRAVHLEVAETNRRALSLYEDAGFRGNADRRLMTVRLGESA